MGSCAHNLPIVRFGRAIRWTLGLGITSLAQRQKASERYYPKGATSQSPLYYHYYYMFYWVNETGLRVNSHSSNINQLPTMPPVVY